MRHILTISQLRRKSTLFLSIESQDILKEDLQIVKIELKRSVVDPSSSCQWKQTKIKHA